MVSEYWAKLINNSDVYKILVVYCVQSVAEVIKPAILRCVVREIV